MNDILKIVDALASSRQALEKMYDIYGGTEEYPADNVPKVIAHDACNKIESAMHILSNLYPAETAETSCDSCGDAEVDLNQAVGFCNGREELLKRDAWLCDECFLDSTGEEN